MQERSPLDHKLTGNRQEKQKERLKGFARNPEQKVKPFSGIEWSDGILSWAHKSTQCNYSWLE